MNSNTFSPSVGSFPSSGTASVPTAPKPRRYDDALFSFVRFLCTAGLVLGATTMTSAQPAPQTPGGGATGLSRAGDVRQASADAKVLIKGRNLQGAEERLAASNALQANTPAWYLETAQKLLRVAGELPREGGLNEVPGVTARVLQLLEQAATAGRAAGNIQTQAQARAIAGYVHERFRGDLAAAIASYQAAVQLDPNDQASEATLGRLQRAQSVLRARNIK